MELTRCLNCPNGKAEMVGSRGDPTSPLVIVGESPGTQEVIKKLPFVGPTGAVLMDALSQDQSFKAEPYFLNAIQCFPGSTKNKEEEKMTQATRTCNGRLVDLIQAYPRKVIVALGNPAVRSLTNNYGLKITQIRGQVFQSTLSERGIVATVHPSFLLRGGIGASHRQFKADISYAMSLCQGNDYRKYIIPKFQVLESVEAINELAQRFAALPEGTPIAADTETGGFSGFDFMRDHILCAGFCVDPHLVYVVPEHLTGSMGPLFKNLCRFVWHNGKYDAKYFRYKRANVRECRVDEDTMLLSYAIDETKGIHNLEQVSSDILGMPDWKFMIKQYLKKGLTYDVIPKPILYDYMSRDISSGLQIYPILRNIVASDRHLEKLYTRLLMRASDYLIRVEENGLELDSSQVELNRKRLEIDAEKYVSEFNAIIIAHGGHEINCGSWQQVQYALYDVLKLPTKDRGTDVSHLEDLVKLYPTKPGIGAVKALMRNRKVQKALGTYVKPALEWVNLDGRVHTTYKIPGTATGRLASEDPNLLNIPRDPLLRGQFRAARGKFYVEVDVNQAELRVLAELSGDLELTRIYTTEGMSIHDEVCVEIFGKHENYTEEEYQYWINKFNVHNFPEKLYDEQKMKAKNVNFGIPYGISAYGLADQIDVTTREAQEYLNKWAKRFPQANTFLLKCRQAVVLGKTIVTYFGRKKRFGAVSNDPRRLNDLQNQASNFPMQSMASDVVLDTGCHMQEQLDRVPEYRDVRIVNTVYDSILFELPVDKQLAIQLATETQEYMKWTAKEWGIKTIPIIGDAKCGERWGNLTSIKKYWQSVEYLQHETGYII